MKIGGLQKVSLIDYPGHVSAIVFTQGCNFRCPYCHNPELVDPLRYRERVEEEEIISFLLKRQGKLDAVSLSGGEPTLQSGVIAFLRRLKDMGYLIKVDTNGSRPDILEKMIEGELLDYIAMDIKAPLEKYPTIVRSEVNPDSISRSIALVRSSGLAYEFRTTLVKALLGLDDILQIAKWISPARRYVLQGFVRSEVLDERLLNESPPSPDELEKIKQTIEKYLPSIGIR